MYYYIINPAAGNGLIGGIQEKLKIKLHKLKIDGEFSKTIGAGDAAEIAQKAIVDGFKTIVAVGGDDTVNEVISAVYKTRAHNTTVGIIPTGKRNLLASKLGLENWEQACLVLSGRRLRAYNLMDINGQVFINCCEFANHPSPKEPNNESFYDRLKNKNKIVLDPVDFKIKTQTDVAFSGLTSSVNVCNQKFINPDLENFLMVRIAENNIPNSLSWINRLKGQAQAYPSYTQFITTQLKASFDKPVQALFDGRKIEDTTFLVSLTSTKIKIVVSKPKNTDF